MDRAARNQEMIVLPSRNMINETFRIKRRSLPLRGPERSNHLLRIGPGLHPEVNAGLGLSVEQVITLVLRIAHAEGRANVFIRRVYLQTQVSPAYRIEKIEPDRETLPEPQPVGLAEQLLRTQENKVRCRHLEPFAGDIQQQAVLLRHAVETPTEIIHAAVQVTDLFHPLAAPRRRIEKRHDTERTPDRAVDTLHEGPRRNHQRPLRAVRIDPIVHTAVKALFMIVEQRPVVEIPPFVLPAGLSIRIVDAQTVYGVFAEPLLNFPTRHIGINRQVRGGRHITGTAAVDDRRPDPAPDMLAGLPEFVRVEIVADAERRKVTENLIVGDILFRHATYFSFRTEQSGNLDDLGTGPQASHRPEQFFIVDTEVCIEYQQRDCAVQAAIQFFSDCIPADPYRAVGRVDGNLSYSPLLRCIYQSHKLCIKFIYMCKHNHFF